MSTTIKDIANKVGVHPSTVSRVLNKQYFSHRISDKTRNKIIKAARELNYQRNEMARGLRLKTTHTIGLVVPDISNPFFSHIVKSVEIEADKQGYAVIICNSDENQEKEIKLIEILKQRQIDGLLIAPVQESYEHFLRLKQENFPFVFIDRQFEEIESTAVITDNYGDAFRATEHLIRLGHKNIGFLGSRMNIYTIQQRLKGYKAALAAYNIPFQSDYLLGSGFTTSSGYEITRRMLADSKSPPSALLISGNLVTIGALQAIHELKISIPYDISIIGFCDAPGVSVFNPPLTSITHPMQEIGKEAFNQLLTIIAKTDNNECKNIILQTRFIIRESTAKWKLPDF